MKRLTNSGCNSYTWSQCRSTGEAYHGKDAGPQTTACDTRDDKLSVFVCSFLGIDSESVGTSPNTNEAPGLKPLSCTS